MFTINKLIGSMTLILHQKHTGQQSKPLSKVTQGLKSNKAYGHDGISIRMLEELCGTSIIKPLFGI